MSSDTPSGVTAQFEAGTELVAVLSRATADIGLEWTPPQSRIVPQFLPVKKQMEIIKHILPRYSR